MSSNIHGMPIGIVVESPLVLAEIVPDAASLKRPAARAGVAATARRVKKRRLSLVVGALSFDTVLPSRAFAANDEWWLRPSLWHAPVEGFACHPREPECTRARSGRSSGPPPCPAAQYRCYTSAKAT